MRKSIACFLLFCCVCCCELTAQSKKSISSDPEWQEAKYGAWSGNGVGAREGTWDTILLKDYAPKSSVVAQTSYIPKAKYPVIDIHSHAYADNAAEIADWVKIMDEVGVETTVVLTESVGKEFDRLVEMYVKPYPGRFLLFCGLDVTDIDKPDYPQRAVDELVRCYQAGARGVGELIDKGWGLSRDKELGPDKRLYPDDPRLDAFWKKCAELKMPISLHVGDHPSAWKPLDVYQERTPDYQHYNNFGKNGASYEELLAIRDRTLEKNPNTTFLVCHMGHQGNDLAALSKVMDKYPNMYIDISARDYELGRTPRAAKNFVTKYAGRILFGTDLGIHKRMYEEWWRLLESSDEFMVGRMWWRYYGLELSKPVLKAIYLDNAKKIFKNSGHGKK